MTLTEFIAEEYDDIAPTPGKAKEWFMRVAQSAIDQNRHEWDCTKIPCTCVVCLLEVILQEYGEYVFGGR